MASNTSLQGVAVPVKPSRETDFDGAIHLIESSIQMEFESRRRFSRRYKRRYLRSYIAALRLLRRERDRQTLREMVRV